MKYKFVIACLLGSGFHVNLSQQVNLQHKIKLLDKNSKHKVPEGSLLHKLMQEMKDDFSSTDDQSQSLSQDDEQSNTKKKAGKIGSNDFGGSERKKSSKAETDKKIDVNENGEKEVESLGGKDEESDKKEDAKDDSEEAAKKKRAELRKKLFGGGDASEESPVANSEKLKKPEKGTKAKGGDKASGGKAKKLEKSPIKTSKRTHRDIGNEDTTHDIFRGDEKETNRDKMSEYDKIVADDHIQGSQHGYRKHSKTGTINAPFNQIKKKVPLAGVPIESHSATSSAPRHIDADEFQHSVLAAQSESGISLVYVTIDNEYQADKLVKRLFSEGLIAQAERTSGFERTYMSLGTMDTQDTRAYLQLTTQDSLVTKVVDYLNSHNQNAYDYPVPDVIATPVTEANPTWAAFVKKSTGKGAGFKYDEADEDDKDGVDTNVDLELDMENEVAAAKADTTHVLQAINEAKKSILGKKAFAPDAVDLSKTSEADKQVTKLAKSVKLNEAELIQAEQMATDLNEEEQSLSEADKKEEKQKLEKQKNKEQREDYESIDLDDEVPNKEPGKK